MQQGATMNALLQDGDLAVRWTTAQRLQALKQIVSPAVAAISRGKHAFVVGF
jgi:hypothetical protein